jgi:hypothetical protein
MNMVTTQRFPHRDRLHLVKIDRLIRRARTRALCGSIDQETDYGNGAIMTLRDHDPLAPAPVPIDALF